LKLKRNIIAFQFALVSPLCRYGFVFPGGAFFNGTKKERDIRNINQA
jgi:hypothetical protein